MSTKLLEIQCPICGKFRTDRGCEAMYPGLVRPCRPCGAFRGKRKVEEKSRDSGKTPAYKPWDHDPWDRIRSEYVTANQLLDGWA